MNEDIKHMKNPIKPYTEWNHWKFKIKQHTVQTVVASGAVIIKEPTKRIKLAERVANVQSQENLNINEGKNSENDKRRTDNNMEEDNNNASVNSDFHIESNSINSRVSRSDK